MKFENLPEHVQYLAAETLKSLLVNQGAAEKEICRGTAENIRSAFESLFDTHSETGREEEIAALFRILADNPRLTVDEALDVFRTRDKHIEKVSKIISGLAQKHGA
ncbi:MAG: hypothetical protein QM578_12625 [Pantoea sp.]|uniref:hypothetical protein n=1 Tax=Pantoea sp. TaxID=69393 RepID=UPI0039E578CD